VIAKNIIFFNKSRDNLKDLKNDKNVLGLLLSKNHPIIGNGYKFKIIYKTILLYKVLNSLLAD